MCEPEPVATLLRHCKLMKVTREEGGKKIKSFTERDINPTSCKSSEIEDIDHQSLYGDEGKCGIISLINTALTLAYKRAWIYPCGGR